MHRFFVSPECISGDAVTLTGGVAHQLARVLRARPGDRIAVLDNSGWQYLVTLEEVSPRRVHGVVADRSPSGGEPGVKLTLYQAVLKVDRFEFVLQKGTELGVSCFVPVFCARSVPMERARPQAASRYDRWRKIVTEAAEQSGRGRVPILEGPAEFSDACEKVEGPAVIPWEREGAASLKSVLRQWRAGGWDGSSLSVFIGPEGGFTQEEVEHARAKDIVPVSLGERILRAETAGIAAVAAIMYELGELGDGAQERRKSCKNPTPE